MAYVFVLFSILFLFVGLVGGWFISEKYNALMEHQRHAFEDLFKHNPHPEIFDEEGQIDRGDYYVISFDSAYDPDEFDLDDLYEE